MAEQLQRLVDEILAFRDARDWAQFHTVKNLALAISIEASELAELTLWKTDTQVDADTSLEECRAKYADEIADILIYLILISDRLKIDPIASSFEKLRRNELRYSIEISKGSAKKQPE